VRSFAFEELPRADLIVGAEYRAHPPGTHINHEPLHRLMPVGNQGGIRTRKHRRAVVLYTQWRDPDWPDHLDQETGTLTYYGDNKRPGRELHDTTKRGNDVLRQVFRSLLDRKYDAIPPIFVFSQLSGRNVRFEGLAVPGSPSIPAEEALVAIWRTSNGLRFQNYRAVLTILDVARIDRVWIDELTDGTKPQLAAPAAWSQFATSGAVAPLLAPRTITYRSRDAQLPSSPVEMGMIQVIHRWFSDNPSGFEACAAEIWRGILLAPARSR
jgi:Restriction endonuclease AspBHI N-terminal